MSGLINTEQQPFNESNPLRTNDLKLRQALGNIYSRNNLGLTVTSITTNYTTTIKDAILFVDATSGNITITLIAANTWGNNKTPIISIIRTDSSANTVTITPQSTDTINTNTAGSSITIIQGKYDFISNSNTAWWYLSGGTNSVFGVTPKASGIDTPTVWVYVGSTPWANATAVINATTGPYISATTAATALTDVVNYTGSGVLDILTHLNSNDFTGGNSSEIKLIVDGVTVCDFTGQQAVYTLVGGGFPTQTATQAYFAVTPGVPIAFSTSIQIQHRNTVAGKATCGTLYRIIKIT